MTDRLILDDVPATAWDAFHAGRPAALAPELVRCWARSRALGAPPEGPRPEDVLLRGDALRAHAGPVELLRAVGDAILDRATARVADRDFLLLLANADGVIVKTSGGGGFAPTAERVLLIEGACWSEDARGTNAIGTAALDNRPTEVHGHAHFGRSYHDLVCYAAPVRGVDGRPIAVLDATSRLDRADPEIGRTILDAARALEELVRLHAYASAGASVARVLGRSLDRMREPAMLIEAPGLIARANASARDLCGANLAGRDAKDAIGVDWPTLVREALAGTPGGCALELGRGSARRAWRLRVDPIAAPGGAIVAVLAVLEPGWTIAAAPVTALLPSRSAPPDDAFAAIVTEDSAVSAAVQWSRQLAQSELPVMLLAETGAGKELFAHAIHRASPRAAGPWHAINCGALAPSLLEAELFGYAPGAFTGAERTGRTGLFHAATGGTLFLDEVAEMSPAMQAALLRVVETGTFRRVGDVRLERTDVRIVCATCRDLGALVTTGGFRQDLYYRLKGATVRIPPLRERTDVLALARHILADRAALSPEACDAVVAYAWPGNVRELKSVLSVAIVATAGAGWIELRHLPPELACATAPTTLGDAEREALVRALTAASGNVSLAARTLGVARSTIHRMKRRYGLA
ncbi:MAG: sigma-54-dependent Fis family transcriptional regulator [Deltaproteobacteria bacterium]|nr:sigma-54-dependent Fis family transcriptional regulator [Deltaproteobacteria bacterium]